MSSTSYGTVSQWSADEGWGVIESLDTPGGCWAHFSVVLGQGNELRTLTVGAVVPFTWESADQDGFSFRAISIGSGQAPTTTAAPSAAYSSTLTVSSDRAMPRPLVKDVPEAPHTVLRARADAAHQPLQEDVRTRLIAEANQPTPDQVHDRAGQRAGGSVSFTAALEAVTRPADEGRSGHRPTAPHRAPTGSAPSYHLSENTEIPCRLVSLPAVGG